MWIGGPDGSSTVKVSLERAPFTTHSGPEKEPWIGVPDLSGPNSVHIPLDEKAPFTRSTVRHETDWLGAPDARGPNAVHIPLETTDRFTAHNGWLIFLFSLG